ncbi:hypothetical protein EVAR_8188_1 [Eumeta japonica]|uniref:Uncharacterized protein n=1 Tax=Eumeta variegata TaxID=151549 RepID=A0A4C1TIY0_EUMVA|nr:hypothetical protein EVAR_8188_1 [Eumeta japonica]
MLRCWYRYRSLYKRDRNPLSVRRTNKAGARALKGMQRRSNSGKCLESVLQHDLGTIRARLCDLAALRYAARDRLKDDLRFDCGRLAIGSAGTRPPLLPPPLCRRPAKSHI